MPLLCSGVASLLWQKLFRVASELRIPAGAPSLICQKQFAFGKGLRGKKIWGCSVLAINWLLSMDIHRRIFENHIGVRVEGL